MCGQCGDDKPAYNVQELEECDRFVDENSKMIRFDGDQHKVTHQVSSCNNLIMVSVNINIEAIMMKFCAFANSLSWLLAHVVDRSI